MIDRIMKVKTKMINKTELHCNLSDTLQLALDFWVMESSPFFGINEYMIFPYLNRHAKKIDHLIMPSRLPPLLAHYVAWAVSNLLHLNSRCLLPKV